MISSATGTQLAKAATRANTASTDNAAGPDATEAPASGAGRDRAALPSADMPFMALVAALERYSGGAGVGEAARPSAERIRFLPSPELSFAPRDVLEVRETAGRVEVTTAFLGLGGAEGPLPPYLAEEILFDAHEAARVAPLLGLFHHRLLSLFVRLWRHALPETLGADGWAQRLLGSSLSEDAAADLNPSWQRLVTPCLLAGTRSARELKTALTVLLNRAVRELPVDDGDGVEPCAPEGLGQSYQAPAASAQEINVEVVSLQAVTLPLESADRLRLGEACHRLGEEALLGDRFVDLSGGVSVRVGPLPRAVHARFAAGGDLAPLLTAVANAFATQGQSLAFQLEVDAASRVAVLGAQATTLGKQTWLAA